MDNLEENAELSNRKLHTMTYKQKLHVITEMEKGKKLGKVATEYGISKSTLHYIFKDRERIKTICEDNPERSNLKRTATLRYPDLEAALLSFVTKARENGERLTGNVIKTMALQTASEMNIAPFSASNGWLNSFSKRNGIVFGGNRSSSCLIDYDPIYEESEFTESKYKIEDEEEPVQWRDWCRLCSSTETLTEFEPFLYDVLQQFLQINFLETVKLCKNCHASLTSISKLMHKSKITEKMFEELEEQERRDCLSNEKIYSIRQQYEEIAVDGQDVTIKEENIDEEVLEDYTENNFLVDVGMDGNNSYDDEGGLSDTLDYNETKSSSEQRSLKRSKKRTSLKVPVDESMYDYTCHICHEHYDRMCFLSNHTRKEHNCLPQVACSCGRFLATWDSLMNHKRKHENQGEWVCDICGSQKMTKSGLKLHMKFKHLRVKPHHLCQVCGKEFKEASGLKQHERSHLPDDEKLIHQCTHCGKRFSQKPTLSAHLRLHTAEKTIICHICSKAFTTQNYLKVHLATHEIENIACSFCDGIFKNKSSLQSHVRKMHKPGNSAFPCHECGKCFPNRNFLKRHMASHSGARNFRCTFAGCEQTYKYEKDLRNHFNIHTNVKKKCLYCDREFIDNSNMRKHVLRNHPVEVAEFEAKFGKRRRLKNLLIENELHNQHTSGANRNSTLNISNISSLGNASLNEVRKQYFTSNLLPQ